MSERGSFVTEYLYHSAEVRALIGKTLAQIADSCVAVNSGVFAGYVSGLRLGEDAELILEGLREAISSAPAEWRGVKFRLVMAAEHFSAQITVDNGAVIVSRIEDRSVQALPCSDDRRPQKIPR